MGSTVRVRQRALQEGPQIGAVPVGLLQSQRAVVWSRLWSLTPAGITRTSGARSARRRLAQLPREWRAQWRGPHIGELFSANRHFGQQPSNPRAQVRLLPGPYVNLLQMDRNRRRRRPWMRKSPSRRSSGIGTTCTGAARSRLLPRLLQTGCEGHVIRVPRARHARRLADASNNTANHRREPRGTPALPAHAE
jgi:hypothetical protein